MNVIRESLNRKKNARGRNQFSGRGRFNSLPVYQRIRPGVTASRNMNAFSKPHTHASSSNSFGSGSDPSNNATTSNFNANSVNFNGQSDDCSAQNVASDTFTSSNINPDKQILKILGSEKLESDKNESITLPCRNNKGEPFNSIGHRSNIDLYQQNKLNSLSSMFPPASSIDGGSMNSDERMTNKEREKSFKLCIDKINFPSTFSEKPYLFDFDDSKQGKSKYETTQNNISNNGRNKLLGNNPHRVPRIVQSINRSNMTTESSMSDLNVCMLLNKPSPDLRCDVESCNYTSNVPIFNRIMDSEMSNSSIANQTSTVQQRKSPVILEDTNTLVNNKTSRSGAVSGLYWTHQRNQHTPDLTSPPAREVHTPKPFQKSEEIISLNLSFTDIKRRRIFYDSRDGMQCYIPTTSSSTHTAPKPLTARSFREDGEAYEPEISPRTPMESQKIFGSPCPGRKNDMTPKPTDRRASGAFQFSSTDSGTKSEMRDTRDKILLHTPSDSCRIPKSATPVRFRENPKLIQGNDNSTSEITSGFLRTPIVNDNSGSAITSGFLRTPTMNQYIPDFTCSPERGVQYTPKPDEPEILQRAPMVSHKMFAIPCSGRKNDMTPKPTDRKVSGAFQLSSADSGLKSIMRDTRDKTSLHIPSDSCRISKSATPVRFRENPKLIQGNDNSGSEITSGFLRSPTVNQYIPDFTCSPERGVQYTPKPADKSIQGLFPLSFFTDSVKISNTCSSKSTKDEMHSLVNSSERQTTPKSSSDKQRTPKSSSDRHRTPKSATSEDSSHNTILAVTEGRGLARGEVGIAVMDTKRPQLVLCQISDVQTYINTLTKVQIFNPVEILVPSTFTENVQAESLFSKLNDNFPQVNLTSVQRRYFSEREGLNLVQRLCLEDYSTIELIIKHKFYALAALAALITFIEHSHSMIFSKKSLKILYQNAEEVMSIDLDTAKRLELVFSTTGDNMHKSLLTVFNYCNTLSGRRFLRANILQPPSNLKVIEKRLKCVDELVQDPMLITNLKVELKNFNDVEQLLWLCMQTPTMSATKSSEMQMNYILLLNMTMKSLPALQECLRETKSERFCKFKKVLEDNHFKLIRENIKKYINEDARPAKGFMPSQQQRCFAIKPGVNGLLDVARNSYSKLIDQTSDIVKTLSEEYDLPLKWHSSFAKGIHIALNTSKNKQFKLKDMPPIFIQVIRSRQNTITCTTEELLVLNQRMKYCLQEIQLMSNVILNELVQEIQRYIGSIYKLCEIIAELDMLVCFGVVSSSSDFVSPIFGSRLELKASRHPILDVVSSSRPVGNDVSASSENNFHVITGPNMGGKSIYIRQIALLQIIAQIGCFVPAEYAEFRVMDCILSRIGFDDSIEHNASTFTMEMRQINYILQQLQTDRRCLVIVDELCRGTSSEEGVAIAWAVCEKLAQSKAFTYVTTHFLLLTTMHNTHPNVSNWHFEAEELSDERLKFTHKLLPGVSTVSNYGIKLARMIALPESIMNDIILLKNKLTQDYQGMMIDTVQEYSADQLVHSVAIVDDIVSAKSNEEISEGLKETMHSVQEYRNSIIDVRHPANIDADIQPMKDKDPLESTDYQPMKEKDPLESTDYQPMKEKDPLESTDYQPMKEKDPLESTDYQPMKEKDPLESTDCQNLSQNESQFQYNEEAESPNVQEHQTHASPVVILTEEMENQCENKQEEEPYSEGKSECNTGELLKHNVSQGSEYCNVEVKLEEMGEKNKDKQESHCNGDENHLKGMKDQDELEDINNNSGNIAINREHPKNLSSQELFDILNTH